MNTESKYIYNDPSFRSRVIVASLSLELSAGKVSIDSYTPEQLNNGEVRGLVTSGYIQLVSSEEAEALKASPVVLPRNQVAQPGPSNESHYAGSSYEEGKLPKNIPVPQLIQIIEGALTQLRQAFDGNSIAPEDASLLASTPAGDRNEDSPMPSSPPKGMQPSELCKNFLQKIYKDKLTFINTSKDMGLLREIIMFEQPSLGNIKEAARRRVKTLNQEIERGNPAK